MGLTGAGVLGADEEFDDIHERREGIDGDAVQKARLARVLRRDDEGGEPARLGGDEDGQEAPHGGAGLPSRESSPKNTVPSSSVPTSCSLAFRRPTATARSKEAPSF